MTERTYIRRAVLIDANRLARLHHDSIQSLSDLLASSYVAARSIEDFENKWQSTLQRECENLDAKPGSSKTWVRVSVDDSVLYGFVTAGPGTDDDLLPPIQGSGLIGRLYVSPHCQRSGTGRLLLEQGVNYLEESGYDPLVLWVFADNSRARRFYEGNKFRPDGATKYGYDLLLLRYRRT